MILVEQTQVLETDLPVAEFRNHLQLGSGFADDGFQDVVLVPQLRASLSAIEGKTGKALIARSFKLVVTAWRDLGRQVLPMAPVSAVTAFRVLDLNDNVEPISASSYRLRPDAHVPVVQSIALTLPTIPVGGMAEIEFTAGYGAWADVPDDLKQAVLMLATHYYESRSAVGSRAAAMPLSVASICRRHAPVRLVGARRV